MRFIPRKEEIERVIYVMERDDFPTGEAMAKAIILEVADMFHFRDWYAVAAKDQPWGWGPWASQADAQAARAKCLGILIPTEPELSGVVPLHPVYGMEQREGGGFGFCVQDGCGHPPYAHAMAGSARGLCVLCKTSGQSTCDKYMESKAKPRAKSSRKKEPAS